MIFLRLKYLEVKEFIKSSNKLIGKLQSEDCILSMNNEENALRALKESLTDILDNYTYSDQKLWKEVEEKDFIHPMHRHLHALMLVTGEKKILQSIVEAVDRKLLSLI